MAIRVQPWDPAYKENIEKFPKTTEEREQFFIFSPLMRVEDPTPQMLIMGLVAVKIAKQPKGLEILRDLGIQYLKTLGKTLQALEEASTANWLNCLINQRLSARVLKRLGLITPQDYAELEAIYGHMFNVAMAKEGIVDTITALGNFAKGAGPLITSLK